MPGKEGNSGPPGRDGMAGLPGIKGFIHNLMCQLLALT